MMFTGGARLHAFTTWRLALCLVLLAALAVRLYGLNWDEGADLHPDELFVAKIVLIDRIHATWPLDLATLLDPARSGLNPRSADPATGQFREYAYGALPLLVTDFVAWVLSRLTGTNWNAMDHAYLVGRFLSALLSALTLVPIAMLGKYVGGPSVGLLAALFAALAPMSIQLAHFFTTDSWLTFFVACALLASTSAAVRGGAGRFAMAGAAFGLAMACKGSVFTLVVPIAVAVAYNAASIWHEAPRPQLVQAAMRNLAAASMAAAAAFIAFEPYALMRPDIYVQSLATQADIVSGRFDVPFTRVYAGTTPFLYQIDQLVRWGYGPVAGLLAMAGIGLLASMALRGRLAASLIMMSWAIPYSAVLFVADVKFLRYLEPLAPVLAVGAALALVRLRGELTTRGWTQIARATAPVLILLALFWAAAFLSIYAHENPRVAATKWIYATVPPGSNLTAEYWDDALPRSLAYAFTSSAFGFGSIVLDLYRDLPPAEASGAIIESLERADFVIQSSQRVEAAMYAAPWRYPAQSRFFDELEAGRLGFSRVKTFQRSPEILGVAIDDNRADESFINYDHPRVTIYERTGNLAAQTFDELMSWANDRPWSPSRAPAESTLFLGTPVGENPSVNDARWSANITSSTTGAVAVWIVLLVVLLAAGLPIARFVFPAFPDAGWGLSRALGLIVAAYPVWLGASLQLYRFRSAWAIVSVFAVVVIGWALHSRQKKSQVARGVPNFGGDRLGSRVWPHAEAAFWLAFVIFLAFRLVVPDGWHPFWGGEKPMEFALINAIGRSAYFPPYDPWFADGYVNYYYYGFYLISFLAKLTGIPVEIAFNLAMPTMMGLIASGGFSVGAALARGVSRSPRLGLLGGWITAAALLLMGNLTTVQNLITGPPARFDPFIFWVWNGSRAIENAITEFPFFTGLYADLHAHVVALPITILAIALAYSVASAGAPASGSMAQAYQQAQRATIVRLLLLALVLGTLSATNAWDVPAYAALAIGCVFMATLDKGLGARQLGTFLVGVAILGFGAWLLFLPFHLHFVALFSQVALVQDPTDLLQFLSHFGGFLVICSIGLTTLLLPRDRISGVQYLGPAAAAVAGCLGLVVLAGAEGGVSQKLGSALIGGAIAGGPLLASWLRLTSPIATGRLSEWLGRMLIVAGAAALAAGVFSGRPVLGLAIGLGMAAATGWLLLWRTPDCFVCLLLAAAFFVGAGVEIVVVADDLIGTAAYRMNTIFKFYNQVWLFLSISSTALVSLMVREVLSHRVIAHRRVVRTSARVSWSRMGVGLAAVFLLASLTYPALAIGPRLAQRFDPGTASGTLNALGWMEQGRVPVVGSSETSEIQYRGDAAAIAWLIENVEGTPVIAEASIGPYRCNGSRISSATGLPTIIGWERHQQQQRNPDVLPPRVQDVRTLYTSTDIAEKTAILRRYNVEYVIVGDLERVYPIANNECSPTGDAAGIAAFEPMIGQTLEVAFADSGTTVFRVLPPGLGA